MPLIFSNSRQLLGRYEYIKTHHYYSDMSTSIGEKFNTHVNDELTTKKGNT